MLAPICWHLSPRSKDLMANVTKVTQLTAALQPHHQLSSLEGIATCSDRISLKSEKTKKTINVMFHYQIYKYIIQKSRSNSYRKKLKNIETSF